MAHAENRDLAPNTASAAARDILLLQARYSPANRMHAASSRQSALTYAHDDICIAGLPPAHTLLCLAHKLVQRLKRMRSLAR